jgi:hypothetical protein
MPLGKGIPNPTDACIYLDMIEFLYGNSIYFKDELYLFM